MILLGMFLHRYVGKVYPEKKMTLTREYAKGEEELAFFCKVLVVEEIGDFYNVVMWRDDRIHRLAQELNKAHHIDETRNPAFGRRYLPEIYEEFAAKWSAKTLDGFREWFVNYLKSSWGDYYNRAMYKDSGLKDGYGLRQMAMKNGVELRQKASQKLANLFLYTSILQEEPEI